VKRERERELKPDFTHFISVFKVSGVPVAFPVAAGRHVWKLAMAFPVLSESVLCLYSVENLAAVVGYSMVSKTCVSRGTYSVGPNR
jgi:hypothetical protein